MTQAVSSSNGIQTVALQGHRILCLLAPARQSSLDLSAACSRLTLGPPTPRATVAGRGADETPWPVRLTTPQQAGLVRHRDGQRLTFVGKIEGQHLHRRRGAGVLAFVHLLGRLLERVPRSEDDRRLPLHSQGQ